MLVRTIKIAAGKYSFAPGVELDIPPGDARTLADDGAVEIIEPEKPRAQARQGSKPTKGDSAKE